MHGTTAGLHGGSGLRQNRIIPIKCRSFFHQIRRVSRQEFFLVPGRQIRGAFQADPFRNDNILSRQLLPHIHLHRTSLADAISGHRGQGLPYRGTYSGLSADNLYV